MTRRLRQRCVGCREVLPWSFLPTCPRCRGLVDVEYELEAVVLRDSDDPLERFLDLLPVASRASLVARPLRFTPTVHAVGVGEALGLDALFLKDESRLPTRTTKDRMAAVALSFLRDVGVRRFTTSSTGNSSTAFAQAIALAPDLEMAIFTAEAFLDRVAAAAGPQVTHYVLRGATFVEASKLAAEHAARNGLVFERGFFDLGRREGLKLAFLEAVEQIPPPIDWYVQAVSSGMGVYGVWKGARELMAMGRIARLPRLLCVQQESCAPMVRAFEDRCERILPRHIVERPSGIAAAILRGDPSGSYPHLLRAVLASGGVFVSVSEGEIREARRMLEEVEGLSPCYSAAAALAGVARLARDGRLAAGETILVNLTGAERAPRAAGDGARWLERTVDGWGEAGERAGGARAS